MKILAACSIGSMGHAQPLLPFCKAARKRGDDVLFVGPKFVEGIVQNEGIAFLAGGEPDHRQVAAIREKLAHAEEFEGSKLANSTLFVRLGARAMLPSMREIFEEFGPQLVLRDPSEYASFVVAKESDIACGQIAISMAKAEVGSIMIASHELESLRLGITDELLSSTYLTRFPEFFDEKLFATTIRYQEPYNQSPSTSQLTQSDEKRPKRGRRQKSIYVSFGTVLPTMPIAGQVYRFAIDALSNLDATVLLTVGENYSLSDLGPLPNNVEVVAWVDQQRAFLHADLVVCHGGSGTVLLALRAGVPLICVPLFADQFINSAKVASIGAGQMFTPKPQSGPRILPSEKDSPHLRKGVQEVLANDTYRQAAKRAGALMGEAPSPSEVLDQLFEQKESC